MLKELNEEFVRENLKLTEIQYRNLFETIGDNFTIRQLFGYLSLFDQEFN